MGDKVVEGVPNSQKSMVLVRFGDIRPRAEKADLRVVDRRDRAVAVLMSFPAVNKLSSSSHRRRQAPAAPAQTEYHGQEDGGADGDGVGDKHRH